MSDGANIVMILCEGLTNEEEKRIRVFENELCGLLIDAGITSRILCSGRTEDGQRKVKFTVRNPDGDIELVGNELKILSAENIFDLLCNSWSSKGL